MFTRRDELRVGTLAERSESNFNEPECCLNYAKVGASARALAFFLFLLGCRAAPAPSNHRDSADGAKYSYTGIVLWGSIGMGNPKLWQTYAFWGTC
jgi:hypothetical protein